MAVRCRAQALFAVACIRVRSKDARSIVPDVSSNILHCAFKERPVRVRVEGERLERVCRERREEVAEACHKHVLGLGVALQS